LTDGVPITKNAQWGRLCYDVASTEYKVNNENFINVRWTFSKSGQMLRLVGDNGDRLEAVLNGTFSTLNDHTFLVQGYIE